MADVIDGGTGEDGGDVTFVGGKAIEQNTAGEEPSGDHGDELAAAKAAVKAAMEEEGKTAAKEAKEARAKDPLVPRDRGPDGKFLSPDPIEKEKAEAVKKLESEPDPDASALRKALAERKETAKYKAEANAELERSRQEVREFHAQLQREKAAVAAERERLAMFRKDPVRAIRENGWDKPEDFILDIATEGTPEGQARRMQRDLITRLEAAENWQKQELANRQRYAAEQESRSKAQFRQSVEQQFLKTSLESKTPDGEDKHPHLASFYKGHEVGLIAEADVVAEQYRNVTGKEASFEEIAEYLEERAAKWYKQMSGRTQAVPPVTQGRPTQGSATGKKSLSPAGSSERRSLGTSIKDLDGDERLEAARTAVAAAIHASGER